MWQGGMAAQDRSSPRCQHQAADGGLGTAAVAVLRHPTGLSSLPQVCPQPHPAMHGCNPWGAPKVWELEGTPGPGKTSSVSSASLLVTQQGDVLALMAFGVNLGTWQGWCSALIHPCLRSGRHVGTSAVCLLFPKWLWKQDTLVSVSQ